MENHEILLESCLSQTIPVPAKGSFYKAVLY